MIPFIGDVQEKQISRDSRAAVAKAWGLQWGLGASGHQGALRSDGNRVNLDVGTLAQCSSV